MTRVAKIVVLLLIAVLWLTPAFAQNAASNKPADNMEILRDKVKADKKLVVADNMQLTESEAKGFWPVYEAYQKDLQKINDRASAIILAYAHAWNTRMMDNQKARKMTSQFLVIQTDEVNLMKSYVPKLEKVLPSVKVARYLQIENKIRAIIRYDMAGSIPLVPNK
jgi:hypothetical protein